MIERFETYEHLEGGDDDLQEGVELEFAYPLSTYTDTISWWVWVLFLIVFIIFYKKYKC